MQLSIVHFMATVHSSSGPCVDNLTSEQCFTLAIGIMHIMVIFTWIYQHFRTNNSTLKRVKTKVGVMLGTVEVKMEKSENQALHS